MVARSTCSAPDERIPLGFTTASPTPAPPRPRCPPLCAGVCAGGGSSEEYSDVEDGGSHTEVVFVKVKGRACVEGQPRSSQIAWMAARAVGPMWGSAVASPAWPLPPCCPTSRLPAPPAARCAGGRLRVPLAQAAHHGPPLAHPAVQARPKAGGVGSLADQQAGGSGGAAGGLPAGCLVVRQPAAQVRRQLCWASNASVLLGCRHPQVPLPLLAALRRRRLATREHWLRQRCRGSGGCSQHRWRRGGKRQGPNHVCSEWGCADGRRRGGAGRAARGCRGGGLACAEGPVDAWCLLPLTAVATATSICPLPPGAPHPAVRHPRHRQAHAAAGPAPRHAHARLGHHPALPALLHSAPACLCMVPLSLLGWNAGNTRCSERVPCAALQSATRLAQLPARPTRPPAPAVGAPPLAVCLPPSAGRRQGVPVVPAPACAPGALSRGPQHLPSQRHGGPAAAQPVVRTSLACSPLPAATAALRAAPPARCPPCWLLPALCPGFCLSPTWCRLCSLAWRCCRIPSLRLAPGAPLRQCCLCLACHSRHAPCSSLELTDVLIGGPPEGASTTSPPFAGEFAR